MTLARSEVDWARLYREGLRVPLGGGKAASTFVVPGATEDLVVLLVPVEQTASGQARDLLAKARDLWQWFNTLRRIA